MIRYFALIFFQAIAIALNAQDYDLILRGGLVYDGEGKPAYRGDVGIRGDSIAFIGNLSTATAKETLDVTGLAVAPGFINMLSWEIGRVHV